MPGQAINSSIRRNMFSHFLGHAASPVAVTQVLEKPKLWVGLIPSAGQPSTTAAAWQALAKAFLKVLKQLCNNSYEELKMKEVAADSKAPSTSDDHQSSLVRLWPTSGLMHPDLYLYWGADSSPLLVCSRVTPSLSRHLHTCTIFLRCWGIIWKKGRME